MAGRTVLLWQASGALGGTIVSAMVPDLVPEALKLPVVLFGAALVTASLFPRLKALCDLIVGWKRGGRMTLVFITCLLGISALYTGYRAYRGDRFLPPENIEAATPPLKVATVADIPTDLPAPSGPPQPPRQALFEGDQMSLKGNQVVGTTPPLFKGNYGIVHDNMFLGPDAPRGAARDAAMRGPNATAKEREEAHVREALLLEITAQYLREHPEVNPPDAHYLAPDTFLNSELKRRGQPWTVMVASTDSYQTYPWHDQAYTRR